MNYFYFVVVFIFAGFYPNFDNAEFFLGNLTSINITRNISCRVNENGGYETSFQLCAIRVYYNQSGNEPASSIVYDGLYFSNTFQQFIQRSCSNWSSTDSRTNDVGISICNTSYLGYDKSDHVRLCICATNECNNDIGSCIDSVDQNNNTNLVSLMPYLEATVECDYDTNSFDACNEHPYIDRNECENYIKNHSVLCGIIVRETGISKTSLIFEDYERYLDKKIHEVRSASTSALQVTFVETNRYAYFNYSVNTTEHLEGCLCKDEPQCNTNIATCSFQTVSTTPITSTNTTSTIVPTSNQTNSTSPTVELTNSTSPTVELTNSTSPTIELINSTSPTIELTNSTSPTIELTNSTSPTVELTNSTSPTVELTNSTSPTVELTNSTNTTTTSISSTSTSVEQTSSTTVTIESTNPVNNTTTNSVATSTTQSSTQRSVAPGEQGLGKAATAGIVCGIVFSAAIFTAEIVYFKFFYRGGTGSGGARSVAYHAGLDFS